MTTYQFQPDYAVPPGWVLEEHLEVSGISPAEFARRCGCTPQHISEIIAGKAPVEAETALLFEKELGLAAGIWLGIERQYRLHQKRTAKAKESGRGRIQTALGQKRDAPCGASGQ